MEDATDRVTASIQTLFRLGSNRRIHQQQLAAAGVQLSPQALRILERTVESDGTTPGHLATRLELDPAVVTRLLRQLEDSGLVRRGRRPDDGRVSTVEATDEGKAAFTAVRDVIWDQVRRALVAWPDDDRTRLAELIEAMVRDVQQEPYRSVAAPSLSTPTGNVCSKTSSM